ncbi:hypothetical protein BKA62DRAFT_825035 [Auriculariales sp. MPI-PUGE-AT-0066]|nr:hypothetical protein BKA62DRAFT_825035 [Auriculariales sp. MPI-PUGE-AT-0066]
MKALFSRFKTSTGRERESATLAGSGNALPQWPPSAPRRSETSVSASLAEVRTLPPIVLTESSPTSFSMPASPTIPARSSSQHHQQQGTSSTTTTVVDSLPPTTLASSGAALETTPKRTITSLDVGRSATATSAAAVTGRTSSSAGHLGSKASLAISARVHPASLRPATVSPSLRSGSPYSQTSTRTAVPMTQSWSEGAEGDLVANLGQRERTRQEVLWEIVASEERYVLELVKLKEVFIEPLLHPYNAQSPSYAGSPEPADGHDYFARDAATLGQSESHEHLPIASRFLSSRMTDTTTSTATHPHPLREETPMIDGESFDTEDDEASEAARARSMEAAKHNHPRSPYGTAARLGQHQRKKLPLVPVPFPTRSHSSLPPPARQHVPGTSEASLGRHNGINGSAQRLLSDSATRASSSPTSRVMRKLQKKPASSGSNGVADGAIPPHLLPEDLRRCLEVLENGIIPGHHVLSEGLRKRYDEQYPLVRSLADVFVANSHILHEYATYVLHLERALAQVDDALTQANNPGKKPKKQDAAEWAKFCAFMQTLEDNAAERSETGLAISLSKPFQRLLKYPLLFQNLLFHTDPSTFEYESTLLMVSEVETIVRSIEDEKIQKEERDKTRDVFARIDGLEKVKMLALPKPSRVLVEERPVPPEMMGDSKGATSPPVSSSSRSSAVKSKSSLKRFSDVLTLGGSSGVGGKRDLWLVVFNDVVLRCQRTGTTTLPMVSGTTSGAPGGPASRTNSMPELSKAKASSGRRASVVKPRNMYKFIKIETWDIGEVAKPREGLVDMGDIIRTRALSNAAPGEVPAMTLEEDEDAGMESDDSDRKSKMSFSYWGADRITLSVPRPKPGVPVKGRTGSSTLLVPGAGRRPQIPSAYGRESSANAKFGTRLVMSPDSGAGAGGSTAARPASRRHNVATAPTASSAAKISHASPSASAWNSTIKVVSPAGVVLAANLAPGPPPPPNGIPRRRTPSTTGANPPRLVSKASTTASEDSGIGLYRQLVTADPSLQGT